MKYVISILALSVLLSACGNSNSRVRGSAWCDPNYEAIKFEVADAKSKTKLDDKAQLDLQDGDYFLTLAEVYIADPVRNIRIHAVVTFNEKGEPSKPDVKCIGTSGDKVIYPEMTPFVFNLENIIPKVIVSSGKTQLGNGVLTIDIRGRKDGIPPIQTSYTSSTETSEKSLVDSFENFDERTQFLFGHDNGYELRNKLADEVAPFKKLIVESRQIWTTRE